MGNQFSYDLDERQIKLILQNAELECADEHWHKFEQLSKIEGKANSKIVMPSINIGISRSVIVPIIFIGLIGGLSAILFSFVDFKKEEKIIKERPLILKIPQQKIEPIKKIITASYDSASISKPVIIAKPITTTIIPPLKESIVKQQKPEISIKEKVIKLDSEKQINTVPPLLKKKSKKVKIEELPIMDVPNLNLNPTVEEPELKLN